MSKNAFKQYVINRDYETKFFRTAAKKGGRRLQKCDNAAKLSSSPNVELILSDRTVSISDGIGERKNK